MYIDYRDYRNYFKIGVAVNNRDDNCIAFLGLSEWQVIICTSIEIIKSDRHMQQMFKCIIIVVYGVIKLATIVWTIFIKKYNFKWSSLQSKFICKKQQRCINIKFIAAKIFAKIYHRLGGSKCTIYIHDVIVSIRSNRLLRYKYLESRLLRTVSYVMRYHI